MTGETPNGRTHEPALRELTAEMDGLRQVMDERDRRYEDRFKAMDEKTSLALNASEKAVVKAETATEKRFDSVNEFRSTLSDQAANLMPRGEAVAKYDALAEKLAALKDDVARSTASQSGSRLTKDDNRAFIGLLSALIFGVIATLVGIGGMLATFWKAAH